MALKHLNSLPNKHQKPPKSIWKLTSQKSALISKTSFTCSSREENLDPPFKSATFIYFFYLKTLVINFNLITNIKDFQ